jgi:hypothetical protein
VGKSAIFWGGGIGIRIVALHLSLSLVPVCAELIPSFGFGFFLFLFRLLGPSTVPQ